MSATEQVYYIIDQDFEEWLQADYWQDIEGNWHDASGEIIAYAFELA